MSRRRQDGVLIGNQEDKAALKNPLARRLVRGFDAALLQLLRETQPASIHEAGCGEGRLARLIQPLYPVPFRASDFSRNLIEENRRTGPPGVQFVCRSIYDLAAPVDTADVILCCEVLEHLEEPDCGIDALRALRARRYILSVPDEPLWRVLNCLRGKYWASLGNTPGHLNHWSARSFCKFVEAHGFRIEKRLHPFPWTMLCASCDTTG